MKRGSRARQLAQFVDQIAAHVAPAEVLFDCEPFGRFKLSVDVIAQNEFIWMHGYLSSARSLWRALKTCDFDVPTEMSSISAIS